MINGKKCAGNTIKCEYRIRHNKKRNTAGIIIMRRITTHNKKCKEIVMTYEHMLRNKLKY